MCTSAESTASFIDELLFLLNGSPLVPAQAPFHVAIDKLPKENARLTEGLVFTLVLADHPPGGFQ